MDPKLSSEMSGLVSGCFDPLHDGHIELFRQTKRHCGYLIVVCPSDDAIRRLKGRRPTARQSHRASLLSHIDLVDSVVLDENVYDDPVFNFLPAVEFYRPDLLFTNNDDPNIATKVTALSPFKCNIKVLTRNFPPTGTISSTDVITALTAPLKMPLRVDIGGGWLDVPRFAKQGEHIVNMAITPGVEYEMVNMPYRSGLGSSAAWSCMSGCDPFVFDAQNGCGWQDPAIITETGLCVWKSGEVPRLDCKTDPWWLRGRFAVGWSYDRDIDIQSVAIKDRPLELIAHAGDVARRGVGMALCGETDRAVDFIERAIRLSYSAQLQEGMPALQVNSVPIAFKYLGSGWGGSVLYMFPSEAVRDAFVITDGSYVPIEPYTQYGKGGMMQTEISVWPGNT